MDNGGPAFPVELPGEPRGKAGPTRHCFPGMTLRDYFAAKALQAMLGNKDALDSLNAIVPADDQDNALARQSYRFADAMLKERGA